MPQNEKAVTDSAPQTETPAQPVQTTQPTKAAKPKAKKAAKAKTAKAAPPKTKKASKLKKAAKAKTASKAKKPAQPAKSVKAKKAGAKKAGKAIKPARPAARKTEELLNSEVVFEGRVFRVLRDRLIEPSGKETTREIIRHSGSAVILALDSGKSKKDPWVVMERQYRHATGQFLWELPAGKLELGESALEGAQRELEEETGYRAKKWKPLVEYFASPGFLGEVMKIFVAEGLTVGNTNWDEDEHIEIRLVKLSEIVKLIEKGAILDGKTLIGVLLYARLLRGKHGK